MTGVYGISRTVNSRHNWCVIQRLYVVYRNAIDDKKARNLAAILFCLKKKTIFYVLCVIILVLNENKLEMIQDIIAIRLNMQNKIYKI